MDVAWCQDYKDQHQKCKSWWHQWQLKSTLWESDLKGPALKQLEAMATELEKKNETVYPAQHVKFPKHIDNSAEAGDKEFLEE